MISSFIVCWLFVSLFIYALGVWSVCHHLKHRIAVNSQISLEPISILKPIKGIEDGFENNLKTFFEQDYSCNFEIVFSSTEIEDPGIVAAKEVARQYPNIPTKFILSPSNFGLNPKVSNLSGALAAARYDFVLLSDANTRLQSGYLVRVVREYLKEGASLLSNIVIGVGERTLGAAMENLHLTAFIAPAVCLVSIFSGVTCVIGKSILFRKSELDEFGGLENFKDLLAEDFYLGTCYHANGKKVLLSKTTVIENVNITNSISQLFSRHSRWLKMHATINLWTFIAELLTNPFPFGTLSILMSGYSTTVIIAVASVIIIKTLIDAYLIYRLRERKMKLRFQLLSPVKDILLWVIWTYASISRSINWRGKKLRICKGSRLEPF